MLPHSERKAFYPDGSPVLVPTGRTLADGSPERAHALAQTYGATNGDFSLAIRAGTQPNPLPGAAPVSAGIPYGGMARLLLAWIVTQASKRGDQTLDLGVTLTAFCRRLDIAPTGGANGRLPYLMDQLYRLCTCSVSYQWRTRHPGRSDVTGQNLLIADRYHLWHCISEGGMPTGEQGGTLRLADAFWRQIMDSVFPFDFRKVQYFRHRPLAFDLYTFLTYRLGQMQKKRQAELALSYDDLHCQLGSHYASNASGQLTVQGKTNFGRRVRQALDAIRKVWPALDVTTPRGRIVLHNTGPNVRHAAPRRDRNTP